MPETTSRSRCVDCGVELQSTTAIRCISCFRAHVRDCPECMENGHLKHKYQKHKPPAKGVLCSRCDEEHNDVRQLDCPVCYGTRMVMGEG